MSFYNVWNAFSNNDIYNQWGDFFYNNLPGYSRVADIFGYSQKRNMENSTQTQIDYEEYLKKGNERALADWQKNVGSQGRTIRYPELTYAGQIYRGNTAIARAGYDYANAGANYYGNAPYRVAGLYGVSGKLSRSL